MKAPGGVAPPALRIDKYLWFVRLARNRAAAQALSERGVIRLNGRRIERAHASVRIGDLITVPLANGVRVIRIVALPARRGPATEAQACYETPQVADVQPLDATQTHQ